MKLVLLVLAVYAATTLISLCGQIETARETQQQLEQEAADTEASIADKQYAIDNSTDPNVIEGVARDKLGMVMPDEEIYYND